MNKLIRKTVLAALLLAALPAAQAAVQNYSFNGTLDSGAYLGQRYSGSFSFDDAGLTGSGAEWLNSVTRLSMTFAGQSYTLADALATAEVDFYNGAFTGLAFSAGTTPANGFSLIAGTEHINDAYLAYVPMAGNAGYGSVAFTQAVPEPESYAMLLAGLGLLGAVARRRAKAA